MFLLGNSRKALPAWVRDTVVPLTRDWEVCSGGFFKTDELNC